VSQQQCAPIIVAPTHIELALAPEVQRSSSSRALFSIVCWSYFCCYRCMRRAVCSLAALSLVPLAELYTFSPKGIFCAQREVRRHVTCCKKIMALHLVAAAVCALPFSPKCDKLITWQKIIKQYIFSCASGNLFNFYILFYRR
jgi:hypothetical protein